MFNKIIPLSFAFSFLFFINVNAQLAVSDKVSSEDYDLDLMKQLVTDSINSYRATGGGEALGLDDVLSQAANDQSDFMTKDAAVGLEQGKAAKKTTGKRVRYYGGSSTGSEEVVFYIPCGKSKDQYTYGKVVSDMMLKLMKNKKNASILLNKTYVYDGVGATMDPSGKKLYVSIVVGTEDAITKGK